MTSPPGGMPGVILIVDDDASVRSLCQRFLARLGHQVITAGSVAEALGLLETEAIDVVVTDLRMPGSSGLELLLEISNRSPDTRRVLMSGQADASDAALAIERGVDGLLLKPFDLAELRITVERAQAEKRTREKAAKDHDTVDTLVRQRESDSRTWIIRAAHALATAVEVKDAYTAGHATRVSAYALVIAELADPALDVGRFRLAAGLHDVGKIGIPDHVLNKPERLTDEEYSLVREHPDNGARILEPLIDDPLVIGVVRSHHERWDGRGYPQGLTGESIPFPARVLAVADTLDAMTSDRAYREGLPWRTAVDEIMRCAGTQFDPAVVQAFHGGLPQIESLHNAFEARESSG